MSNINILVHPQVMFVISNHYSRFKYDKVNPPLPVHCGLLLGSIGDNYEVTSAMEVIVVVGENGKLKLDQRFMKSCLELINTVYKSTVPIGWYTLDSKSDESLLRIKDAFDELQEFNLSLVGNFSIDPAHPNDPPFTIYFQKGNSFQVAPYSYESAYAENIAMIQLQSEGNPESQIQFTKNAFTSLSMDLERIEKYLQSVRDKKLPFNAELVRRAADFAQWWDHNNAEEQYTDRADEQANLALLCGLMLQTMVAYDKSKK